MIKQRKIERATLDELAKRYPQDIISDEDTRYIIGGTGACSGGDRCYTYDQYLAKDRSDSWDGGCVVMNIDSIHIPPF